MKRLGLLLVWISLLLTACFTGQPSTPIVNQAPVVEQPAEEAVTPAAESTAPETAAGDGQVVTLTVLYTDDEHGWMAGEDIGQGAAELAGLWAAYAEKGEVLVLSGGDNWTGPAISTWFDGESMTEVMNAMGYAASAIGNHEFDFGLDTLYARTDQADFPYLAANLRYKADGSQPTDLGIQAYTLVEVGGLQIGLIGLSNTNTPTVTNPDVVAGLEFGDYEAALRETVPLVREAGADLIFVPTHICRSELTSLAGKVQDLGIALFGGGHCHERFGASAGGAVLLAGGANYRSYAYATFQIDDNSGEIISVDYGTADNQRGRADSEIAAIVERWQAETDQELNVTIGYLDQPIIQQSDEMAALITEAWLWAYPADISVTNWGGMRTDIPAGEVTFAAIIGVMPFNNVLVDVTLTGAQLATVLEAGNSIPAIGGMELQGGRWILRSTGTELDSETTYHVLFNDFMYAGGDGYDLLAEYDPDAYNTAIDWRQPVIDWILAQESSPEQPLDAAVEALIP